MQLAKPQRKSKAPGNENEIGWNKKHEIRSQNQDSRVVKAKAQSKIKNVETKTRVLGPRLWTRAIKTQVEAANVVFVLQCFVFADQAKCVAGAETLVLN
jgi:hypothetical protein